MNSGGQFRRFVEEWNLWRTILLAFALLPPSLLFPKPAQSQDAETLFSEAKSYQDKQRWDRAEESYRQFLRQSPASAAGHSNLGIVYVHERKYQQAVREYQTALRIDSSLSGVNLNLGIAFFREGNYAAVTPVLQKFLSGDSENRQARELLGLCDLELDKYEDAVKMLAPLRGEGNLEILVALSASYIRLRRIPEAEVILKELLSSPSANTAQVHFLMGQTYAGLNNFPEALEEFKAASKLDSGWPGIRLLLGATEARLGHNLEAEADLRQQLQLTPGSFETLFTLGALLNKNGRPQDAIPFLLRAQKLKPGSGDVKYQLADAYWKTSSREEAWDAIRAAVRLDRENRQAHYLYAQIASRRGEKATAQREFRFAESLSAKNAEQDVLRLSEESTAADKERSPTSKGPFE